MSSQPGFEDLVLELGLVEYWETVAWGDVCRRRDTELVCNDEGLDSAITAELLGR